MARHSATLFAAAALLVLAMAADMAGASQLNIYNGSGCTGQTTYCRDRACCIVPSDAVSYRFYYNPEWKAYLYASSNCTGTSNGVIDASADCVAGVSFKSAFLTDNNGIEMVTDN
ncbi:unnamed protein product [Spirodela intermedia]|uniref:Uncharacterized protein n=2 Tax=Spirodela intermedia TaxID=51605 RepID=A0A7I8L629_SPIIN|nr:unnamed protein product [Spirodela intermedia]CAA6668620.1 unnamed protein product [Spirodela intermedia]CAA7405507.1 unnamed protein product [Spirodela intermedia]